MLGTWWWVLGTGAGCWVLGTGYWCRVLGYWVPGTGSGLKARRLQGQETPRPGPRPGHQGQDIKARTPWPGHQCPVSMARTPMPGLNAKTTLPGLNAKDTTARSQCQGHHWPGTPLARNTTAQTPLARNTTAWTPLPGLLVSMPGHHCLASLSQCLVSKAARVHHTCTVPRRHFRTKQWFYWSKLVKKQWFIGTSLRAVRPARPTFSLKNH